MNDYPLSSYLAVLADSDLFGNLALFNLCVLLAGLHRGVRCSLDYRVVCALALLCLPVLHAAGTWYLNQRVA
ncbi:hypothetical protein ACI2JQ_01590 [Pseudomonas fulva]|uniref:hypothetical protein n=1 Tax=Pseudomonas TaxID=286 RepID=UPI0007227DA3|nr:MULTISPECIES: hypothetical protein [Pseudomonas]MBH3361520.1 hypothetical protein [Pseudomonas sp. URMO17WK12:I11]MDH0620327.1 hypothetical protein [Pseudomonas fulva]CRN07751.1 hypothetical protein PYEL_35970 [Pseudomonas sp. URMO17WK12:I11]